jgi:hypothetical protein
MVSLGEELRFALGVFVELDVWGELEFSRVEQVVG